MTKTISVIVPTYNEKDNVVPLVDKIHESLSKYDHEIIFVDDNSADGTAELASSLSSKYPVKVLVRKNQRGLSSAVIHGFNNSEGEYLAVIDADLQHPPELLEDMLKSATSGADLVIASRYIPGGSCIGWSLSRRTISKGAILITHLFLPKSRRFSDPLAGFFLIRKNVVQNVILKPTGYKILLEVLVLGNYKTVAEVPCNFQLRARGKSKLNIREQIYFLRHLESLMARSGELIRFFKFCIVGSSGVIVNEGLYWMLTRFAGFTLLASSAVSIETSIITNFVFNNYFTFRDRKAGGRLSFLRRLGMFNLVSLVGLTLNMGVLLLFTNVFHILDLYSNLVGIAVAMIWNYIVNLGWTWK